MRKLMLLSLIVAATCWGQSIDPATLHIGTGHGNTCAHGCAGEPNIISSTLLSIFQQSGGAPALSNPVILLLGIPVLSGGSFPAAPGAPVVTYFAGDAGSGVAVAALLILRGASNCGATSGYNGADGCLTSGEEMYGDAKFDNTTNNSNSFTNMSPFAPGVTYFAIYAYRINVTGFSGGDLLNVDFSGSPLPLHTFAIAYGCKPASVPGDALDGACAGGSMDTYATPFTEAGFVSGGPPIIPEPATITLTGAGLLGVLALRARRKYDAKAA